jgi:mono/diheme cytochrome c family protein
MNVYQATKVLLKWLVIANAIIGFSAYGFAQDNDFGKMEYQSSCGPCHGTNGKGDGRLSGELRMTPPDLTLVVAQNSEC